MNAGGSCAVCLRAELLRGLHIEDMVYFEVTNGIRVYSSVTHLENAEHNFCGNRRLFEWSALGVISVSVGDVALSGHS